LNLKFGYFITLVCVFNAFFEFYELAVLYNLASYLVDSKFYLYTYIFS